MLLSRPSAENASDCFFMLRLGLRGIIRPSKTSRQALGATYWNPKRVGDGA